MKQFIFAVSFIAALAVFTQTSCYYDNEVEQYGLTPCDTVALTYNGHIQTIIQANCVSCHGPGGEQEQVPFDSYNNLKPYETNLVDRIHGKNGVSIMPDRKSVV